MNTVIRRFAVQLTKSRSFSVNSSASLAMVKAKKFIYKTPFQGEPKVTDFELVEEDLPDLQQNGESSTIFISIILSRYYLF